MVFSEGTAALGHRRLSIIDTTTNSDQPFVSGDGKFILVFNGEIYNFIELREELRREDLFFVQLVIPRYYLLLFNIGGITASNV